MVKAESSIIVDAPVEKVWSLLIDTEKLPEWMPLLMDVSDIQGEGVGETFKWTYKFIGIKFEGSSTVEERITNQKSVVKSKAGIESIWTWGLTPDGNATKVALLVEYTIPIPVLGKFAEGFVVKQGNRDIKFTLENFKNFLES
jgi:uncharacterized membrane protein